MHPFWIAYIVCVVICLSVCIASIFSERISYASSIDSLSSFMGAVFFAVFPVFNFFMALLVLLTTADHYKPKHWS